MTRLMSSFLRRISLAGVLLMAACATITTTPTAAVPPVTRTFDDGIVMVQVPVGCFEMGSATEGQQPLHEQCFDRPFWIDRTEVTQSDFVRLNGVKANPNQFEGENRPVDSISWFEAQEFCERREARLPTEAEWEYAARGPENRIYPWGNEFEEERVVYAGTEGSGTKPVGSQPAGASWSGALDIAGNVAEWVSSLAMPYPYVATDGREANTGNRTDVARVLRGGSYGFYAIETLSTTYRDGRTPSSSLRDNGFRCARDG